MDALHSRPARALVCMMLLGLAAGGCQHSRGEARPAGNQPRSAGAAADGTVLDTDELGGARATQVEELLAGRFAGVRVFRQGDGIAVQIRGATSLMGSNEPLYVVDGMPVETGAGGVLVGINPSDIARIEVLKDIGSTAFYGVRGANGVVLISTRRHR
jgi:TonB-dependent SusC/RagA subfamily outer membrane receptor